MCNINSFTLILNGGHGEKPVSPRSSLLESTDIRARHMAHVAAAAAAAALTSVDNENVVYLLELWYMQTWLWGVPARLHHERVWPQHQPGRPVHLLPDVCKAACAGAPSELTCSWLTRVHVCACALQIPFHAAAPEECLLQPGTVHAGGRRGVLRPRGHPFLPGENSYLPAHRWAHHTSGWFLLQNERPALGTRPPVVVGVFLLLNSTASVDNL